MKTKKITTMALLSLLVSLISGCSSTKTAEVNVIATTDLHGSIPYEISSYVQEESKKDKNITIVDAGDFFDTESEASLEMIKYFDKIRENYENNTNEYVEAPIAKEMKNEVGYDAVVLGNHEFICNDKKYLDYMISDFEKQGIDVLSANTYKKNGENYTKPYIIKDIKTPEGTVKLGILGLTIKEVGEKYDYVENVGLVKAKSRELKDMYGYNGQLYMNDLVTDAQKWVKQMKEDKADIIVAAIHSGEKPKKPKNPGNRIQEIAKEVDGIDAIVAGHTHKQISQHDYENKSGQNVIVTQPGKHGECISKINFQLEKDGDKWNIVDKSSELTKFGKKMDEERGWELPVNILYSEKKEITLSEMTSFDWDKAYIFEPGASKEDMYKVAGYKWRKINADGRNKWQQMVFMKDKKVVCYLYGHEESSNLTIDLDKSYYKDNVATIFPKKNDKFKVKVNKRDEDRGGADIYLKNIK